MDCLWLPYGPAIVMLIANFGTPNVLTPKVSIVNIPNYLPRSRDTGHPATIHQLLPQMERVEQRIRAMKAN